MEAENNVEDLTPKEDESAEIRGGAAYLEFHGVDGEASSTSTGVPSVHDISISKISN